jgi:hypothetical protein
MQRSLRKLYVVLIHLISAAEEGGSIGRHIWISATFGTGLLPRVFDAETSFGNVLPQGIRLLGQRAIEALSNREHELREPFRTLIQLLWSTYANWATRQLNWRDASARCIVRMRPDNFTKHNAAREGRWDILDALLKAA